MVFHMALDLCRNDRILTRLTPDYPVMRQVLKNLVEVCHIVCFVSVTVLRPSSHSLSLCTIYLSSGTAEEAMLL